jgi:hypothetical protein
MKILLASIVLVTTGVVLVWGVNTSINGVSVNTLGGGLILIGLIAALARLVASAGRDGFDSAARRGDDQTLRGT